MVLIVTAYGKDNYFQKNHEDIVGIYTDVERAIAGAQSDGMTSDQLDYLNKIDAFHQLNVAMEQKCFCEFQVDYDCEDNDCKSSYMFKTYKLN